MDQLPEIDHRNPEHHPEPEALTDRRRFITRALVSSALTLLPDWKSFEAFLKSKLEKAPQTPEQRYEFETSLILQEARARWPELFDEKTRERFHSNGSTNKSPKEFSRESRGNSCTIGLGANGEPLLLKEIVSGKRIEANFARGDVRRESKNTVKTSYDWFTKTDTLHAERSIDNTEGLLIANGEKIDPNAASESVMNSLSTPQRMYLFERAYSTFHAPRDPLEFKSTFRMSFAQWQSNNFRQGACNTYAEAAAETLSAHGYPMHILTLSPKKLLSLNPWHICTGFPLEDGTWMMIDEPQGNLVYEASPESYADRLNMQLTPVHSVMKWRRESTQEKRLLQHVTG